jgi:uncharacterized repeat protein (TIGR03803 family)
MKHKIVMLAVGTVCLLGVVLPVRAQVFTALHSFANTPDGANPRQLAWMNGFFYGATANGGANGQGSIFKFDTNGSVLTTVYSFTGATNNGSQPNNLLVTNNMIYGTAYGGTNSVGMIFAINPNGTGFTPLYSFARTNVPPDGNTPLAGLITDGGMLYGTAHAGGTNGGGALFKISTSGTGYTILHWFTTNAPDGFSPQSELVLSGGMLYGTTTAGGVSNLGTVFAIGTNGTGYTTLHSFTNTVNGQSPYGGLVLNSGMLYGTTGGGTGTTNGSIFSINTNGSGFQILHVFTSTGLATNADGKTPRATLTFSGGYLYGTAISGGVGAGGTLFRLSTNGTGFTVIHSFTNNSATGSDLESGVLLLGNSLWGTTYAGGTAFYGILYSEQLSPTITAQPQSLAVTNGNPATFTVSAADDSQTNYQWYFNTNTLLGGQTNNTLALAGVTTNNGGTYTVVVSDSFGSVTSSPANLTVIVASARPAIIQQPQDYTVTSGYTASFTNVASGTPPLFYQWYFNTNTPVSGGTNAILVIVSVTNSQAGYYSVIVTNSYGSATSAPAKLTVAVASVPPAITQQPQNFTVTNGSTASFTNVASGTPPLSYQWYFNTNTPVSGGTNAILVLAGATTNQAGYYLVIVSNAAGTATSAPARLTVIVPPSPPTIIQQPQDYTVTNGSTAIFTNVASGTAPLSYQWYFNTNTPVADGTNSVLVIAFATTNQAGYYSVIVTNSAGSATSSPARLTVISTRPIIVSPPQNLIVTNGNTASFSVLAAGQNPLKYQWYSNAISTAIGTLLAGQTNSTYSFTSITNSNGRYYSVVVTNTFGRATSSPALLTVVSAPLIVSNPQPATVSVGNPANFSVTALGLNLHYQWYSNTVSATIGTLLAGQTNSNYSFTSITNSNGRYYSVVVTNTFGRATSSPALLTVSSLPYIILQPLDAAITLGDSVTFTSTAAGPGPLGYQWLFQTNLPISGATATNLVFTNANQPGAYSMKVTNGFGSVTSDVAQLTVVGQPLMLSAKFDPASGSYAFSYVNLAGSTNRLWATTNLAAANFWRAIATNVMATNGIWFFTDTNSAKTNKLRFYQFSTP